MSLSLVSCTDTTGKLLRRQLYQNGVLSNALDHMPRDDQIILLSPPEKAAASGNDQSKDPGVVSVELKITGISQARAVTQVDDLQISKVRRAATLHNTVVSFPFFLWKAPQAVYAKRPIYLAVQSFFLKKPPENIGRLILRVTYNE